MVPPFHQALRKCCALASVIAPAVAGFAPQPVQAESTLTVAMTAGDIPATTGNPDQGFEGFRFVGYDLYDGLALWDLSKSDKPSDIKPGLVHRVRRGVAGDEANGQVVHRNERVQGHGFATGQS